MIEEGVNSVGRKEERKRSKKNRTGQRQRMRELLKLTYKTEFYQFSV